MRILNVLIACEESQRVCLAFREYAANNNFICNAYSCDIQQCSGGHPEFHINSDVLPLLNGNCSFVTADGVTHTIEGKWDLLICHPPCTLLTTSGNRWFDVERYGDKAIERLANRQEAIDFFMKFVNADCDRIIIENPIGIMSSVYKKPTQIIQPYMFGDPERKATCLWMKGMNPLCPTNIVEPNIIRYKNGKGSSSSWHMQTINLPPDERRRVRSKTFPGIANALAKQCSDFILNEKYNTQLNSES